VGFVAPHLFHSSYELELGMALCAGHPGGPRHHPRRSGCATWCRASNCCPLAWVAAAGYLGFLYGPASRRRPPGRSLFAHGWTPTPDFDTCLLLLVLLWLAGALLVLKRGVRLGWVPRQGVKPFAVELAGAHAIGYLGYEVGTPTPAIAEWSGIFMGR